MADARIVYCLTRDRELAIALDEQLERAIAFFYNDAARLNQAVTLRAPDVVVVDTDAVRPEYGDAGLGPVFDFVRRRAGEAMLSVRPVAGGELLVAAEAGPGVTVLPSVRDDCARAIVQLVGS
jgi:hypothetical protein